MEVSQMRRSTVDVGSSQTTRNVKEPRKKNCYITYTVVEFIREKFVCWKPAFEIIKFRK